MPNYDMPIPLDPNTMQPIDGGVSQQPNFRWQAKAGNQVRGLIGNQDLALALLANSGYSPQKRSFGEIVGTSMLQANQMKQGREDDAFKRQYMQAQMQAMGGRPVAVVGPDGKPQYVREQESYGKQPVGSGSDGGIGAIQPGDYTPASLAKYKQSGNVADLVRYAAPRQETSKPFQNITRTYQDGSTQQGSFDTRTGDFMPTGPVIPPGKKPEADAAGNARGKVAGDLQAKGPRAYEQFKIGIGNLETAMENTVTGPFMGRIPALTSAQQTAEGSEAIMAPVLKQLFRESGEGTFTEGDQALLLKMVPNRTDHAEARKAKIEMIDGIVRAKLGISEGQNTPPPGIAAPPSQSGKETAAQRAKRLGL
jgi:hypothetical protein